MKNKKIKKVKPAKLKLGRPPGDDPTKSRTVSLRDTEVEKLEDKYGTLTIAIRTLL